MRKKPKPNPWVEEIKKIPGRRTIEAILVLHAGGAAGIGACEFGGAMWKGKRRGRVVSSNGGGDYAAQCMLGRMRVAGLVEQAPSVGSSMWRLSSLGRTYADRSVHGSRAGAPSPEDPVAKL